MAIQPVDLSVIYSQMDNVAKFNASQNQLAQVANQQGREQAAEANLEKSKIVQEAAQDELESNTIKNNLTEGSGGQGSASYAKKKKPKQEEEKPSAPQKEFSDPLLGRYIDIMQ